MSWAIESGRFRLAKQRLSAPERHDPDHPLPEGGLRTGMCDELGPAFGADLPSACVCLSRFDCFQVR